MSNDLVELEITDLAFNGKAVAHRDGKVVFLRGCVPGDKVLAEISRRKPRYDEAVVREILQMSPARVEAPCPHVDICGGCTFQNLAYTHQLLFKQKQVSDCLERIGNLDNVRLYDIVGSPELFNYRNKMEFSFHVAEDTGFNLGLHRRGRFDEIFDLQKCFLQPELGNRIVHWVRDFVKREGITVYDVRNHTGFMRFVVLRMARRTDHVMVNLVTNYGDIPNWPALIRGMRAEFPEVTTLVHNQNGQKSNVAVGEKERVLYGPGYIEESLFDRRLRIRANSFFQTNSVQTETLYRFAFDMLMPDRGDRVLDLYCGTGSIGILLAQYVHDVVGVELVEDSVAVARENATVNHVNNITFHQADAKDFLRSSAVTEEPFDIIVVDPPRAGLNPKALRRLLRLQPLKILYISCNPATFARDAEKLAEAGYCLPEARAVDMFPHTMHIEVIGVFVRT